MLDNNRFNNNNTYRDNTMQGYSVLSLLLMMFSSDMFIQMLIQYAPTFVKGTGGYLIIFFELRKAHVKI